MKLNNFPLKAIALAVSMAMVPSVYAQTNVTVDTTGAVPGAVSTTAAGDIDNQQSTDAAVTAAAADDIVVGTTVIDGVTGAVDIDVNANSVELLAAGNGLLLSEGGDVNALGATINEIDIPVGSTDGTQAISSGQLTQGATSATEVNALSIGTSLSGNVTGAIDVDANSNSVQLSSQANAVDNRIQGDLSAATGVPGNATPTATTAGGVAIATIDPGSDLSIASAQGSTGASSATLTPSSGLIGVELSSANLLDADAAVAIDASSNSLGADAGGNSAINQFDVDGGGVISRNIANAQLLAATANSDVDISGVDIGVTGPTTAGNTNFDSTLDITVNSTGVDGDADGNEAINQILVDLNAAGSNQEINSNQLADSAVSSDLVGLNVGLNQDTALANIVGDTLSLEVLSTDVDATANDNSATNNISLQGISAGALSDVTNLQDGAGSNLANVNTIAVGISSVANLPEVDLDVSSTQLNATSGFNDATNQVLLGGIASDTNNNVTNTQTATGGSQAQVIGTSVGLASSGLLNDGAVSGTNTIDVLATQLGAAATTNNAVNNINSSQGADNSDNDVVNAQTAASTAASVTTNTIGASLTGTGAVSAATAIATNSSAVASSALGNVADNDITLVGTGVESDNNLGSTQTVTAGTSADISALDIGLQANSAAGGLTFDADVSVEALSNSANATATAASADNRVAIGQIAIDSVNTVANIQVVDAASNVSATSANVAIGITAEGNGTTFSGPAGVVLDVSSSDVSTNATGTEATNQILFTGIAGNTATNVNTLGNDQDVNSNVASSTTFTNIGLSSTADTLTAVSLDTTTLANTVSSESDANSATNSINSLGSLENSVNALTNTQDVGAAVAVSSLTSSTTFGANSTAALAVAGDAAVSSSSNVASSTARVNTANNAITVADSGSASGSVNDIVSTQATGAGSSVASRVGRTDIGLFSSGAASTIGGEVSSTTNSNTLASFATVNTAVNAIDPAGIADTSDNEIANTQTVVGTVSSTAGLAATNDVINIGVFASDTAVTGTFLIAASSNNVSASANGNVGLNTISNQTSSQNSVNLITSTQANTGSTTVLTNAINIGADVNDVGGAGTFTLVANSNDVVASIGLNSVNNIIGLDTLGTGTNNEIANSQTATLDAPTTATVDEVNIGATTADATPAVGLNVTVQSNSVEANSVANSALNVISVDNLGNNAGADIANTQALDGAGNAFSSAVTNVDLGLSFSAPVTSSADLVAQVSGNDVLANATGNTAINTVSTTILGGGVGNASIANTQSISNSTISAQIGATNVGITGAGSIAGVVGNVTVNADNNSIGASAIGNAAVNRITGL